MTLMFGLSFLICPYTCLWESHSTKDISIQSPAWPTQANCSPHFQLPWDTPQEWLHRPHPELSTLAYFVICLPFPKISFYTIFKFPYLPSLWSLPWSPQHWNQHFFSELLILYVKFSWGFYPFMPFITIIKAYFPYYIIKLMSSFPLYVLHIKDTQ